MKEAELQARIEQVQKELKEAEFGGEGMLCYESRFVTSHGLSSVYLLTKTKTDYVYLSHASMYYYTVQCIIIMCFNVSLNNNNNKTLFSGHSP